NEPDYIELVYACARLGVIVVPLNTRLSVKEIDGILDDAKPGGLIRHSSLSVPTVQVSWQVVLDQDPLDIQSNSITDPIYDPKEPDYIELVYACARLGVIVVPLNTRLSVKEIDGILDDAKPGGLIRHSSLSVPTVQVSWQVVLDQDPLDIQSNSITDPIYDP